MVEKNSFLVYLFNRVKLSSLNKMFINFKKRKRENETFMENISQKLP